MTTGYDPIEPCAACGSRALPWFFWHSGAGGRPDAPLQVLIKCTGCGMSTGPVIIGGIDSIGDATKRALYHWRHGLDLSQTDWIYLAQMTDDEIEAAADADDAEL